MAAKKKTVKKTATKRVAKKAPAKKAPAKKAAAKGKAKRYTPEEKAEIVAFAKAQGRGGQTAAAKKYGVSPISVGAWVKKAGGGKAAKATKAPKATTTGGNVYQQVAKLAGEVQALEATLEAKKKELGKVAAKLATS